MKLVLGVLRPFSGRMALGFLCKVAGALCDLLLPLILAHMLDNVAPSGMLRHVLLWGGAMALCACGAMAGNILGNRVASGVARDAARTLRHDLFAKVLRLSGAQVDRFTIPSLESRLTSDTYNVHNMIARMQKLGVRAPILLAGGIAVSATLEPALTMVLAAALPFMAAAVLGTARLSVPLYTRQQRAADGMVRVVRENAQGVRVIKALSRQPREAARFAEANSALADAAFTASAATAAANPLMNLCLNLGLVGVILIGAKRVDSGISEPGAITAFLVYFTLISNAMLSVARLFLIYAKGTASAARIAEVLEAGDELPLLPPSPAKEGCGYLCFENVSFSYNGGKNDIENVCFQLERGQTLGIIGATGSGKSTLLGLLLRAYDPGSGTVRIEGSDIRELPGLRGRFGAALQQDFLYTGTIAENIDFGRGLPEHAIRAAAEDAQADAFISAFPDGYAHLLAAKGANLSGGQRQRLLIARALAGAPDILLLDDASSALDYRTDAALRAALRRQQRPATIIASQRVSAVMHADRILVLDGGRPIAQGTHEELMTDCALYREIAETQLQ
ncbi:ABC transporter ATP-binding protein [Clostridiaceae bacterium]|nr:ABC transporter ATP-binding protein [Clostridiaceae bacterium]